MSVCQTNPAIEPAGELCLFKADLTGSNFSKIAPPAFPGWSKWKDGTRWLLFKPTDNNIRYINEHWPDTEWNAGARRHLDRFIDEQIKASQIVANKKEILEDDGSYRYRIAPFDHQRQAFLLSRDRPVFAYFMEQGTGKTKLDIDVTCYNYSQGKIQAWVIIAPNGVQDNWIDPELPAHVPEWCPYKAWTYSSNLTKQKLQDFEDVMNAEGVLKVFAFNVEGFVSEKAQKLLQRIILTYKTKVTIDESDVIKNHTAHRTKYLTKACDGLEMKRILTGTEVTKGLEDLFAQCNFLGEEVLGYDNYTSFKNHFCTMGGFKFKEIVGYKNVDEMIKLLDAYSFRVLKKDCLDLPEKIYKRWKIDLSPQQRKIYDDLRKTFFAESEGKMVTAQLGIVRMQRLQQIACGWFPADGEEHLSRIPGDNPRLEATLQHCRLTPGKVIVWTRYVADVKDITEELCREHGRDIVASYYGATEREDRAIVKDEFQKGNLKYLVANKAAARGLTLTACENPIYHSNSFDWGDRKQSEDRTHRIGTVNNVTYTDIEARKTIDGRIISCLKNKQKIADMIKESADTLFMEDRE